MPTCKMGVILPLFGVLERLNEVRDSDVRGSRVLVYNLDLDCGAKLARYKSQLHLFASHVTSCK